MYAMPFRLNGTVTVRDMGLFKKKEKTAAPVRDETKDMEFRLILNKGVKLLPNTEVVVYPPLGIRSPGGICGAKLTSMLEGYERGDYEETFLEIRKYVRQNRTACLGLVKLSIAAHIRWWLEEGRIPSEGDQQRMKDAFICAAKVNTVVESYFSFCAEVAKEIDGEMDEETLIEKVRLYTGEDSPVIASDDDYSSLEGDGWYPMLSHKYLTRLPNTDRAYFKPLGLFCPATDD